MSERQSSRKDAIRNREAVLAAADALFSRRASPEDVTMADVAAAAGVGKGTLFRAFGDRAGLLRALYEARLEPIRGAIETGPPPLGPGTPPQDRVRALLDAVLCFKLDNGPLALALEDSGSDSSPYRADHYERWHGLLRAVLEQIPGLADSDFTAHALLAATRADLVEHLAGEGGFRGSGCGNSSRASSPRSLPLAHGRAGSSRVRGERRVRRRTARSPVVTLRVGTGLCAVREGCRRGSTAAQGHRMTMGRAHGSLWDHAASKPPALTPATKEENAAAATARAGPPGFFESRTGTVPVVAAVVGAHSTQVPPLSL